MGTIFKTLLLTIIIGLNGILYAQQGTDIEDFESGYGDNTVLNLSGNFDSDQWMVRHGQGTNGSVGIIRNGTGLGKVKWLTNSQIADPGDTLVASIDFRWDPLDNAFSEDYKQVASLRVADNSGSFLDHAYLRLFSMSSDSYRLYFDAKESGAYCRTGRWYTI